MFNLEAGYGYAESEFEGQNFDIDVSTYYLQATITLAPGVFIIPEVGQYDYKLSELETDVTYYGKKWMINF
jgi:hypothetical protein